LFLFPDRDKRNAILSFGFLKKIKNKRRNMEREWSFWVECSTLPGEEVCVTGSCPELGSWKADNVIRMSTESDKTSSGWTE
jgi:hypothetical protein